MKTCKNCGRDVQEDFNVCPYCGLSLSEERVENSPANGIPEDVAEKVAEPNEQIKIETDSAAEKTDIAIEESNNKGSRSKKKTLLFCIIAVVLISVVALSCILFAKPSVKSIEATYDGDRSEGIVLDSRNKGFEVIGKDEEGNDVIIKNWKITEPKTLYHDESEKVRIEYKDLYCDVTVKCSTSAVSSITVSYEGSREDGYTIESNNTTGLSVSALLNNGEEEDITSDCEIDNLPIVFKADESVVIAAKYVDPISEKVFKDSKKILCSTQTIVGIHASYKGSKAEGVVLDENNDDIIVKVEYKNGTKEIIDGWTVKKAVKLKADETSTVTILYEGKSCSLSVTCSTMSPATYKAKCKSISYTNLARNPSQYEGDYVKFTGKVVQVIESSFYKAYRVNVTRSRYGYYDDTVYVTFITFEDGNRVLEDDIITFYGEYEGLYSYETVMGATVTIPKISAEYIEIQ